MKIISNKDYVLKIPDHLKWFEKVRSQFSYVIMTLSYPSVGLFDYS